MENNKWHKLAFHPVGFVVTSVHVIKENVCKNCHNYRNNVCYLLPHNKLPQYKEGKCKDDSCKEGVQPICPVFIIHRPHNNCYALAGTGRKPCHTYKFSVVQFKVRSEIHAGGSIYIQTFGYCISVYLYSPRASLPRHAVKHGQIDPVYSMHAERVEQKLPITWLQNLWSASRQ